MKMKWCKKEDDLIISNYNDGDFSDFLFKSLNNRTLLAIKYRARDLGCRVSKDKIKKKRSEESLKGRESNKGFKGYRELGGAYITHTRNHAISRGISCPLLDGFIENNKYLYELFDGHCSLSGVKIQFSSQKRKALCPASLDRIDSLKGYIRGNVQWVHKDINLMKWHVPNDEFLTFVKEIYLNTIKPNEKS